MSIPAPFVAPEEIRVNGKTAMTAHGGLAVVFNNLVGVNFATAREHQDYLQYMGTVLDLADLHTGATLSFVVNREVVATAHCGDPKASRVTLEMIHAAMREQLQTLQQKLEDLELRHAMGQELGNEEAQEREIDEILAANPYMLHPDFGVALKSVVQAEDCSAVL